MQTTRKVRLIEPHGRPGRPFNAWISRWPLLGPITLATILKDRGHDAAVYNENISGPVDCNAEAYADLCSADVVGISIMTPTANRGYAIAERLRRDAPQVTIAFGGVHATFKPKEALAHGDVVVCGEGENVIEQIATGEIGSGIVRPAPLADMDRLPMLDHTLMRDFDKLLSLYPARELYELPVMTSRGCPYGCTYCSVTRMFGRKVRRQSPEKVFRDIRRYMDRGFRRFFFYDDNFTSDRAWSKRLLEKMGSLRVRFDAQVRVDFHRARGRRESVDAPLLKAMRRAGADVLYIGYETIDELTAKQWHKGYRGAGPLEERLYEDTRILRDNGFWIHAMFVLGPQDTQRTANRMVDFARRSNIETMQVSILTPFPGTPLMEQVRPHLVFTEYPGDWDFYDGTHCVYGHARLGIEGMQQAVLDANRRFYGWSGWSAGRIRGLLEQRLPMRTKLAQVWQNAKTARAMLKQWREENKQFLELVRDRTGS